MRSRSCAVYVRYVTCGERRGDGELAVQAKGYGLFRIRTTLAAGAQTLTLNLRANWASQYQGATASGGGEDIPALIDDTEATNWGRTGATPDVRGSQVTVDLSGARVRSAACRSARC
jgi:hypothetical protein